ncbi:serine/threonine protein kinase [Zobellella aerophila]|uniref:Stress response kinase A n=1 Tax=Zobellella aerophila TaxID=870480 RepID=A0ABP6VZI1_9GAMM
MEYTQLTPDFIADALGSMDIYLDSGLLALNSYENRVYRFKNDELGALVVKFYRPERWCKEQIQEEHGFLTALSQAGVRVAAPMSLQGETLFEYQGRLFALWQSVGGRQFEADNLEQLEALGEQLGRLHQVGGAFPLRHRPRLTTADYLHQSYDMLKQKAQIKAGSTAREFFGVLERLITKAEPLYRPRHELTLHCDCHVGNILWRDGPLLVDFDDCRSGPAVQDIWMMLSGSRQEQLVQLDTILAGYETVRNFSQAELALIEPLRAMRMVHHMAWLAARWQDPAFPANFPWFNTDDYWLQQTRILSDQLTALDAPPLSLTSWN